MRIVVKAYYNKGTAYIALGIFKDAKKAYYAPIDHIANTDEVELKNIEFNR